MATSAQQSTETAPPIPGTSLIVADLTALSALSTANLTFGTLVWVVSAAATYQLSSNAGTSEWNVFTSGGGSGITALTGDVTASGTGSVAATLANIPTTATMAGKVTATAIAAPATPAAGLGSIYVDSTSKNLCVKDDAGVVKHGVQSDAGTAGSVITAITDAGAPTKTAIATVLTAGGVPVLTDVLTTAGSDVTDLTQSGLDGDADGNYQIFGEVIYKDASGASGFVFRPFGSNDTGLLSLTVSNNGSGAISGTNTNTPQAYWYIGGENESTGSNVKIVFSAFITSVRGRVRQFYCRATTTRAGGAPACVDTIGWTTDTTTNITALTIHAGVAGSLATGSYFITRKLRCTL